MVGKQADQKEQHDSRAKPREVFVGQRVMVRNIQPGQAWVPSTVVERQGHLSYLVQVYNGRVWKRHLDHLCEMNDSLQEDEVSPSHAVPLPVPGRAHVPEPEQQSTSVETAADTASPPADTPSETVSAPTPSTSESTSGGASVAPPSPQPAATTPAKSRGTSSRYPLRDREKHRRFK